MLTLFIWMWKGICILSVIILALIILGMIGLIWDIVDNIRK